MNITNHKKTKIIVLRIGTLPSNLNPGQGEACHQLFKSSLFQTIMFSPSQPKEKYHYELNKFGNKLYFLLFPSLIFPRNINFLKKSFLSSLRILNVLIASLIILSKSKIYSARIIHIHHIFFSIPAVIFKLLRKKAIITIHGSDIYKIKNSFILRNVLKIFDKILVVSLIQKKLLEDFIDVNKIYYIANGVDNSFYKPKLNYVERENIIISIGSLRWQKNHKILVEAFSDIHYRYPDWKLIILGEGKERKNLEYLINQNDLEKYISLKGSLDKIKVRDWLLKSKIFVICSLTEGLPKALLEASASGCACIATDVGDCSKVLEDIGLISINNDKNNLIFNIERLIKDQNLSNLLSIKSVEKVKYYSWETYINIHKDLYHQLLS